MVYNKTKQIPHKDIVVSDQFHVVYLGENGFPVGFGAIQKMILISKALIAEGAKVTVINRKGKFLPGENIDVQKEGSYEGIHYVYTSDSIYRPAGFINRNLAKVKGSFREFLLLRKLKRSGQLDAAIISCYSFFHVLLYRLYARLLNFPVVYNYVEMARVLDSRQGFWTKINDYLFERFLIPSMDGSFPISEVLIRQFEKIAPQKKWLKIPIIGEFDKFDIPYIKPERDYFAYCGALAYQEVIDFVLNAYDQLPVEDPVDLHLILGGGTTSEYKNLLERIEQLKKAAQVKVFRNVRHADIPRHYRPARALLIPMRKTLQDAARFPHKIAEYVASGNPMISTNFGEVAHYFTDGKDALIADDYDTSRFAEKMQFVLDHPQEAQRIGQAGKQLGLEAFNHYTYGPKIISFLRALKY